MFRQKTELSETKILRVMVTPTTKINTLTKKDSNLVFPFNCQSKEKLYMLKD